MSVREDVISVAIVVVYIVGMNLLIHYLTSHSTDANGSPIKYQDRIR